MPSASKDSRFSRDSWSKKVTKDGEWWDCIFFLSQVQNLWRQNRQLPEGGPVAQSVFKLALEGLDKLREKKCSDMEVMIAAISVAESPAGFSTGDMERIITFQDGKSMAVSQEDAKGIKLMVTLLMTQGMIKDPSEDMNTASAVNFLKDGSDSKKQAWVKNYNKARKEALADVEKK